MKIAIANDHVGYELKQVVIDYLKSKGHEVVDFGAYGAERCDYPVYGEKAARAVAAGDCDLGVLICGTGFGISLTANKVQGIRAVVCSEPYTARLARQHNNANIVSIGARVIGSEMALFIIEEFLNAEFQGGRHQIRLDQIADLERRERLPE